MITIIDEAGLLHLLPDKRLINIALQPTDPANDPPGAVVKLVLLYELGVPTVGQTVFFFSDMTFVNNIKQVLLNWAASNGMTQLVINAAGGPPPEVPPEAANLSL